MFLMNYCDRSGWMTGKTRLRTDQRWRALFGQRDGGDRKDDRELSMEEAAFLGLCVFLGHDGRMGNERRKNTEGRSVFIPSQHMLQSWSCRKIESDIWPRKHIIKQLVSDRVSPNRWVRPSQTCIKYNLKR